MRIVGMGWEYFFEGARGRIEDHGIAFKARNENKRKHHRLLRISYEKKQSDYASQCETFQIEVIKSRFSFCGGEKNPSNSVFFKAEVDEKGRWRN